MPAATLSRDIIFQSPCRQRNLKSFLRNDRIRGEKMLSIEKLKAFGADTEDGLARCMGMEDFYLGLVAEAAKTLDTKELETAVKKGDLAAAFETAHAMKGVLANLSLSPVLKPVSEITELLRKREEADYTPLIHEIKTQAKKLISLME
jgi:HPt (histidine-containing phosphotransfer) domain-containing protein